MAAEKKETARKARRTKRTDEEKRAAQTVEAADAAEAPAEAAVSASKKRGPKKGAAKKVAKKPAQDKAPDAKKARRERLFALDIGTRSVIGIVAEQEADGSLTILDTARREHRTRAMLDGQIHDVPEVAAVIEDVKRSLAKSAGPLKSVAVAAAGRALYTMTAEAEAELSGVISEEEEHRLDFAGVQAAQAKLAASAEVDDPTRYYCVGYSTIKYALDGIQLKSLVGQRGRKASATVIATFLPRQVIDSMDSALDAAKLSLKAITLEPIAAINVLIPPTMRHLNLVLVDIGAGTSDVAVTKNGSVVAYGMVPQAGDEITEAISQHFLLDFNVAERIKREAAEGKPVTFTDILGQTYQLRADEVLEPVAPSVQQLAEAIARQIKDLNGSEPQAVLLVGGGALTPDLARLVAEKLGLPSGRVAVRHPDAVDGIAALPPELTLPDAVTPLGILKIAALNTLHFLTVYVGGTEYRLFNFRTLTVSDALLTAGVQLKKSNGKPGLGIQVKINGEAKIFPGTMGTLASVTMNGAPAEIDTPIENGARIEVVPGEDGATPRLTAADILDVPEPYTLYINGNEKKLAPALLINGAPPAEDRILADGDEITTSKTRSVGEALKTAGYLPAGKKIKYKLNGNETQFTCIPEILVNDRPAPLSTTIHEGDRIEYHLPDDPKLGEVLGLSELDTSLVVYFNGAEHKIPSASVKLELNGRPATANAIITEGCSVQYDRSERRTTLVSAALLAVGFEPPLPTSGMLVEIQVNGETASFNDPIKNGDRLDVHIHLAAGVAAAHPLSAKPAPGKEEPPAPAVDENGLKDGLLPGLLAQLEKEKPDPRPKKTGSATSAWSRGRR